MLIAEFVHVHRNLPQLFAANGDRLAVVTDHNIDSNFKRSVCLCVWLCDRPECWVLCACSTAGPLPIDINGFRGNRSTRYRNVSELIEKEKFFHFTRKVQLKFWYFVHMSTSWMQHNQSNIKTKIRIAWWRGAGCPVDYCFYSAHSIEASILLFYH